MLRPLSLGEALDASFKVYGRNVLTMAKAVVVIALPIGILTALVRASVTASSTTVSPFSSTTTTTTGVHISGSQIAASLITEVLSLVSAALCTAIIYRIVGDAYLGQTPDWRSAIRTAWTKAHSVLWVEILAALVFLLIFAVPVVLIVLAAIHSVGLGVLIGLPLGGAAIVAAVWFYVIAHMALPSLMLEGYKGKKAFRRSGHLVRHLWWRTFGCMFLMSLIVDVGSAVVAGILVAILVALAHSSLAQDIATALSQVLVTAFLTPILASTYVVLSIDLRVRKEGYDIQLLASHLGSQPGARPLDFFPRPPLIWGSPGQGPWGSPPRGPGPSPWSPPPGPWGPPPGPWSPPAGQSPPPWAYPPPPPGQPYGAPPPPPPPGSPYPPPSPSASPAGSPPPPVSSGESEATGNERANGIGQDPRDDPSQQSPPDG